MLTDGREASTPTEWSDRLAEALQERRDHFEVEPEGLIVELPELDEDVGVWTLPGMPEAGS